MHRYTRVEGIEDDEFSIPGSKTVQSRKPNAAGREADEIGDSDYDHVSSHDLKRCLVSF